MNYLASALDSADGAIETDTRFQKILGHVQSQGSAGDYPGAAGW